MGWHYLFFCPLPSFLITSKSMSKLLYNFGLFFYTSFIHIAAIIGNSKAKKWQEGRKDIFKKLRKAFANNSSPVLWIHCASLGEFEQGRPVIEVLKSKNKHLKILLTFFSPSGYEVRQNYAGADWVFYLPSDSKKNALQFLSIVKPQQVIFVKYEFWYHYLSILHQQKTPTYLISAIFRPNQAFFKWYGQLFRDMLFCFDAIFVQNEPSLTLLKQVNYPNAYVAGDTRLDRVLEIKKQAKSFSVIDSFSNTNYHIVAGSTWSPDEKILADILKESPNYKLIIAPHQIDEKHLQEIETLFKFTTCIRYSNAEETKLLDHYSVLLIDNIGMLSSIYAYGDVAYIGGGFGLGIHNILEAVVFEIPVLFGPNYHKFQEAKDLIATEVAFEVNNSKETFIQLQNLQDTQICASIKKKAHSYFRKHSGASLMILNHLNKQIEKDMGKN